jgi:hypothetical protein
MKDTVRLSIFLTMLGVGAALLATGILRHDDHETVLGLSQVVVMAFLAALRINDAKSI